jgi:hypothetical protein
MEKSLNQKELYCFNCNTLVYTCDYEKCTKHFDKYEYCDGVDSHHDGGPCDLCNAYYCQACFYNDDVVLRTISPDYCQDIQRCNRRRKNKNLSEIKER